MKNTKFGFIFFIGLILIIGGVWGSYFTYKNVAKENIITPADASIPNKKVRGPFTLWSQIQVIRKHTLNSTEGKVYAEMPRMVEKKDNSGKTILDENGQALMIPNEARNIWITATTLNTALSMAIISYAFSMSIAIIGIAFVILNYKKKN